MVNLDPDPLTVDEEPWDLTERATAATGAWLTATAVVVALLGVVLIVAYHLARGR